MTRVRRIISSPFNSYSVFIFIIPFLGFLTLSFLLALVALVGVIGRDLPLGDFAGEAIILSFYYFSSINSNMFLV